MNARMDSHPFGSLACLTLQVQMSSDVFEVLAMNLQTNIDLKEFWDDEKPNPAHRDFVGAAVYL